MLISGLLLLAAAGAAQSFVFVPIDVPCSDCAGGIARSTVATGINPDGEIVGSYVDALGKSHGFLLGEEGFSTLDVPGSLIGVEGTLPTNANGINPAGRIVGQFTAPYNPPASTTAPVDSPAYCPAAGSAACIKGFLYSRRRFSPVLFPEHPGAIAQRITPRGDVYGCLHDYDTMMSMFGAAWTRSGDVSLQAGGGELADPLSVPMSMNNGATPGGHMIVGLWNDMMTGRRHGFVVENGVFQSYDVSDSTLTAIWDVNPEREFVGTYVDSAGNRHGFLQRPNRSLPVTIDYPGATATIVYGINPDGVMVGQYSAAGRVHGFLAVPVEKED
jgi:uncharacterized membrane protein